MTVTPTPPSQPAPRQAALIIIGDKSRPLGEFESYITQAMTAWTTDYLASQYDNLQRTFITHGAIADEDGVEGFLTHQQATETRISTAYALANKLIDEEYADHDVHVLYFGKGNNSGKDIPAHFRERERLIKNCKLFAYGEVASASGRWQTQAMDDAITLSRKNPAVTFFDVEREGDAAIGIQRMFFPERYVPIDHSV